MGAGSAGGNTGAERAHAEPAGCFFGCGGGGYGWCGDSYRETVRDGGALGSNPGTRCRQRWWSRDDSALGPKAFLCPWSWRYYRDGGALGSCTYSGSYSSTWCWSGHGSPDDSRTMGKVIRSGSRSGSWTIRGKQVHAIQAYWSAGRGPRYGTCAAGVVPEWDAGDRE